MLASCPAIKKMETECGAVTTQRGDADAESTFTCTKRNFSKINFNVLDQDQVTIEFYSTGKNIRRKLKTTIVDATTPVSENLIDLNDDCLYIIFDMIRRDSVSDFYSLSQTCKRLNDIGSEIFQRKVKVCDLRNITDAATVMSVLNTFRSAISELRICLMSISYSDSLSIMESIICYCTELKSLTIDGCIVPANNQNEISKLGLLFKDLDELHLKDIYFEESDDINQTAKEPLISNIFNSCQSSLISLNVVSCYHFKQAIFECSFPKLEHFAYRSGTHEGCNNVNDFILRHRNLKSFRMDSEDINYLEALASGCKNLTNLNIRLDTKPYLYPFSHQRQHSISSDSVKCLAKFQNLKELTVECCGYVSATKLIDVLPQLAQSLECLHVESFSRGLTLIPAVIQLKKLRILRLHEHTGTIDISRIGELTQLIELSLIDVDVKKVDLIKMVNDLVNLKKLVFYVDDFRLTNELYVQLVYVLKPRKPENQRIDMYCRTATDFVQDSQTMLKIKF